MCTLICRNIQDEKALCRGDIVKNDRFLGDRLFCVIDFFTPPVPFRLFPAIKKHFPQKLNGGVVRGSYKDWINIIFMF